MNPSKPDGQETHWYRFEARPALRGFVIVAIDPEEESEPPFPIAWLQDEEAAKATAWLLNNLKHEKVLVAAIVGASAVAPKEPT